MSSNVWAKLWIELIDDPKMARLPDWCFRRFIYFLLLAKEYDKEGLLPPVPDMAWRLRLREEQITEALCALEKIGVVCEDAGNYSLTNFAKRQAISNSTERVRKHRMKRDVTRYDSSSSSLSSSNSDSLSLIIKSYESEIGVITGAIADKIQVYLDDDINPQWLIDAMRISAEQNKRSWAYVEAILKRWIAQGNQENNKQKGKAVTKQDEEDIINELAKAKPRKR